MGIVVIYVLLIVGIGLVAYGLYQIERAQHKVCKACKLTVSDCTCRKY